MVHVDVNKVLVSAVGIMPQNRKDNPRLFRVMLLWLFWLQMSPPA